ncbi:MAG: hypothetical protein ABI358_02435, partial [Ginsengibacter sp.]
TMRKSTNQKKAFAEQARKNVQGNRVSLELLFLLSRVKECLKTKKKTFLFKGKSDKQKRSGPTNKSNFYFKGKSKLKAFSLCRIAGVHSKEISSKNTFPFFAR